MSFTAEVALGGATAAIFLFILNNLLGVFLTWLFNRFSKDGP